MFGDEIKYKCRLYWPRSAYLIIHTVQFIFSVEIVFFSYNNSVKNGVFQPIQLSFSEGHRRFIIDVRNRQRRHTGAKAEPRRDA